MMLIITKAIPPQLIMIPSSTSHVGILATLGMEIDGEGCSFEEKSYGEQKSQAR